MPQEYTSEQIQKLYQNLPEDLREAIFSLETADVIYNTCKTYGLTQGQAGKISDAVGEVLAGLLLPLEFPKTIKKETNLPEVLVRVITQEINRFIFYPVKQSLGELQTMEITPSEKPTEPKEVAPKPPEKPPTSSGQDVYRESVE